MKSKHINNLKPKNPNPEKGFSLIELIIVMLIISILSVMAVLSFRAEKKYSADTQAYQVMDIFNEARQRSLTQHKTMRIEINQTRNIVRLINENDPANLKDDKEIRTITLMSPAYVVVGAAPQNSYQVPTEMSPTPALTFKKSLYATSNGDMVATLRYAKNGIVYDAGSNAAADNSAMTGATIYFWIPDYSSANKPLLTGSVIRAITVQGTSGLANYWKCPITRGGCYGWIQQK